MCDAFMEQMVGTWVCKPGDASGAAEVGALCGMDENASLYADNGFKKVIRKLDGGLWESINYVGGVEHKEVFNFDGFIQMDMPGVDPSSAEMKLRFEDGQMIGEGTINGVYTKTVSTIKDGFSYVTTHVQDSVMTMKLSKVD